ncbi:MAG: XrtA/PEP-CTERM system TPR-repeat protein PrsT [Halioglobus sp.]
MLKLVQSLSLLLFCSAILLTSPTGNAQETSGDFYEDARQRFDTGDAPGALIQLKNALRLDPQHVPSLVLTGDIYLADNDPVAAEDAFSDALLLGADKSYVTLKLAQAYLAQGKYQNLLRELKLENFGGSSRVELLAYHGEAHVRLGQLEEAERVLLEAENLDPSAQLPQMAIITLHIRKGELLKAETAVQRLLDAGAQDSRIWNAYASVWHAQGRRRDALEYYGKAIELAPDSIDARIARIGLLVDLNRDSETAEDLAYLKEHSPYDPRAAYLRGLIYDRAGDTAASQEALRECVEILASIPIEDVGRDAQLAMPAALAHYGLGDFELAHNYLLQFFRHHPGNLSASRLMGSVLIALGESRDAVKFLRPLTLIHDSDLELISLLAAAYNQTGQYDKSISLLKGLQRRNFVDSQLDARLALTQLQAGEQAKAIDELATIFPREGSGGEVGMALSFAYLQQRKYDQAIEVASTLVARDPDNADYRNLLGLSHYIANDFAAAATVFEELLEENAGLLPVQINLVRVRLAQGQFDVARDQLLSLLEEHPENGALMLERARLERLEGNLIEARRWGENALRAQPDEMEGRIFVTEVYLDLEEIDAAEKLAKETTLRMDQSPESMTILGQVLARAGKRKEALAVYTKMSKQQSFNSEAQYKIALLQLELQAYREARHSLYKSLESNPDNLEANIVYIDLHLPLGDFEKVLRLSEAAMERFPDHPSWHNLQGAAYLQLGDYAKAEAAYVEAIKLSTESRYTIGLYRALLAQDKRKAAESVLRDGLRESPKNKTLKVALTEFLLADGRWQDGKKSLQELLSQEPANPQYLNNLANVLFILGEDGALELAQRAQTADPSDPMINDTLGWLLVNEGKPQEALKYLREATTRSANNSELRYHLAVALEKLGRGIEARKELDAALSGAGNARWKADAVALQGRLQKQ